MPVTVPVRSGAHRITPEEEQFRRQQQAIHDAQIRTFPDGTTMTNREFEMLPVTEQWKRIGLTEPTGPPGTPGPDYRNPNIETPLTIEEFNKAWGGMVAAPDFLKSGTPALPQIAPPMSLPGITPPQSITTPSTVAGQQPNPVTVPEQFQIGDNWKSPLTKKNPLADNWASLY